MSEAPNENEIRRIVSRAWSRRRRKTDSPTVRKARHLDLNNELEEPGGEAIKFFLLILALFALLIYAASKMIGLE